MAASNMEKRIEQLVERLRSASEKGGAEWREGPGKSYILNIGDYAVTLNKDADPQLAIYDQGGEELEAVERAELEGKTAPDGRNYAELTDKVWRLARRSAGTAEAAFDKILNMLDGKPAAESAGAAPAAPEAAEAAPAEAEEPEMAPQAPQAGMEEHEAEEDDAVQRPAAANNGSTSGVEEDDEDEPPARRPFWS